VKNTLVLDFCMGNDNNDDDDGGGGGGTRDEMR
jgi:hypothetical protein